MSSTASIGLFYAFAAVAAGSALYVAASRNLARAIFMLFFSLGAVAAFYGWFGADFLMIVQLLIYVGGILVILIFAMMISEHFPVEEERRSLNKDLAGFMVAGILFGLLTMVAFATPWPAPQAPAVEPTASLLGGPLLTRYLLPFELAGVILLVALIGATLLTRRDTVSSHSQNAS